MIALVPADEIEVADIKLHSVLDKCFPRLSDEQYLELEAEIVADGRIRDPIVLCRIGDDRTLYVADGHNRLDIWGNNKLPQPEFVLKEFESIVHAELWVRRNQITLRRNLTPQQDAYSIGREYQLEKIVVTNPGGLGGS